MEIIFLGYLADPNRLRKEGAESEAMSRRLGFDLSIAHGEPKPQPAVQHFAPSKTFILSLLHWSNVLLFQGNDV